MEWDTLTLEKDAERYFAVITLNRPANFNAISTNQPAIFGSLSYIEEEEIFGQQLSPTEKGFLFRGRPERTENMTKLQMNATETVCEDVYGCFRISETTYRIS